MIIKDEESLLCNKKENENHNDNHNISSPLENNEIKLMIRLSNIIKWGLYATYFEIFVLTALESGFIPANKIEIAKALKSNDTEFGFLGSSDYIGRIIGGHI